MRYTVGKLKNGEIMLTNKVQLETKTANSDHTYICANNAPLQEVYEALTQFRTYVYGRMKEVEEQQKATAEASAEQPKG